MKRALLIALALLSGSAWSADVTLPDYERIELDNGTVLLLSEKHDVPLVGMRAVVRGGSAADPASPKRLPVLVAHCPRVRTSRPFPFRPSSCLETWSS
jgi:hypothetical protein